MLPIASITKLMTALVVVDGQANLSMDERLTVTKEDVDSDRRVLVRGLRDGHHLEHAARCCICR